MKRYSAVFFFFLFFSSNLFAEEKIVFIDINFIFNNSDAGKELKEKISKKNLNLQSEIKQYRLEIEDKRKKIISQKNVLSVDEYNIKIAKLETDIKNINSIIIKKRDELTKYQKKIENDFSKSLNSLIEKFSVQNSIDIILNKENLLMAKKNLDITNQIFDLFNLEVKSIKVE